MLNPTTNKIYIITLIASQYEVATSLNSRLHITPYQRENIFYEQPAEFIDTARQRFKHLHLNCIAPNVCTQTPRLQQTKLVIQEARKIRISERKRYVKMQSLINAERVIWNTQRYGREYLWHTLPLIKRGIVIS